SERTLVWRPHPGRELATRSAGRGLDARIGEDAHIMTARDEPARDAELRWNDAATLPRREQEPLLHHRSPFAFFISRTPRASSAIARTVSSSSSPRRSTSQV